MGLVQTAYANGNSTRYITDVLVGHKVEVALVFLKYGTNTSKMYIINEGG